MRTFAEFTKILAVVAAAGLLGGAAHAQISTFDSDLDGWQEESPPDIDIFWEATGGNPDGFLRSYDASGASANILAPAKFLGDFSSFDGVGSISSDQILIDRDFHANTHPPTYSLSGPGGSASFTFATLRSEGSWLRFEAPLDEAQWNVISGTWLGLLQNVTSLVLNAESTLGHDVNGFDNIAWWPCLADTDCDGLPDSVDNCPVVWNPGQEDFDMDGFGDVCDDCPFDPGNDWDGDLICFEDDNCPGAFNPLQENSDTDDFGDACDNCTQVFNPTQTDTDIDYFGNACDGDFNNDCVVNSFDLVLFDAAIGSGMNDPLYDLNEDGFVNGGDIPVFVGLLANGLPGPNYSGVCPSPPPPLSCADAVDNDGDGFCDTATGTCRDGSTPGDPGCADDTLDLSEKDDTGAYPCDDGVDNDGDGGIDFVPFTFANPGDQTTPPSGSGDPGCGHPTWSTESPQCQDGLDNSDGDGMIDYDAGYFANGFADPNGPDPQCIAPWWNSEAPWSNWCGLGAELALLLPPLMWMWRRRSLH